MGLKENNRVRTFGVIPAYNADPIPVRLATEAEGDGLKENNRVRTFGVIPAEGADPILVEFGAASNVCRIKTGTYTGDGTLSQAVVGVGFRPKYVRIWTNPTVAGALPVSEKMNEFGTYAVIGWDEAGAGWAHYALTDRINTLDADGFTVDDGGIDIHPNKNGVTYDYLALG